MPGMPGAARKSDDTYEEYGCASAVRGNGYMNAGARASKQAPQARRERLPSESEAAIPALPMMDRMSECRGRQDARSSCTYFPAGKIKGG